MVAEDNEEYRLDPFIKNEGRFKTISGRNIYYYGEEFGDALKRYNLLIQNLDKKFKIKGNLE